MNKKEILYICIAIILIVIGIIYYIHENFSKSEEFISTIDVDNSINLQTEETTIEEQKIKVYITGEVNVPGVFEISEGERIEDLIKHAGGVTLDANLSNVNLAYKLEDGQKVYIPNKEEKDVIILSTENGENVIQESQEKEKSGKVNINTANIEKLCEVPGIGEAMAKRIISYREENGKFKTIEDIKNVSGIGDKKLENMKEFIVIKWQRRKRFYFEICNNKNSNFYRTKY